MKRASFGLALTLFAVAAFGQTPADAWKTVTTPHFRLHYPVACEAWSLRAASKLESIRDAVVAETGYDPKPVTDVLVVNPLAQANGATYPLLDTPRIVLFAEPAGPDDIIGDYSSWIDLLVVHEMTHMVHLVRPSRNPFSRVLEHILPIGPLALAAPRWVTEGYATVVEGRLTGSGRPSSSIRAAILRKWAQSGRLPSYGQLQIDRSFLGMSMAYLAGSAYLEWLEERAGAGSLLKLWPRMNARQKRSFDEAFQGVFGDSPQRLYGEFTAELTERAVSVDRTSRGALREGELWQETAYDSGDPAVSPDGKQIAIVLRARSKPSRLVIWSTGAPEEEEKKSSERLKKMLERDPEDVAPVRSKPLKRKAVHELTLPDGGDIEQPRWMADGRILFGHRLPDANGDLHHDLFAWSPTTGALSRLTHLADVSDADPLPGDREAVAVRTRNGSSQLVSVDLSTGDVRALTEPSLDRVYSHPRVSRNGSSAGKRVAFAAHESGTWHLVIRDLAGGAEKVMETPLRANVAGPEWSSTGDGVFATVYDGGFIEIHRFDPDGTNVAVTRSTGASEQAAPSPDGRLFFMSLEPDGFTLRVLKDVAPAPSREAIARSLVPALPPAPASARPFEARQTALPRPYGIGRQEPDVILNGSDAAEAHSIEVGLRFGDVVGRLDTLAVAAFGSRSSQRGATVATAWRGWPVAVAGQVYTARESEEKQRGIEVRGSWDTRFPLLTFGTEAGVLGSRVTGENAPRETRNLAFASASLRGRRNFGETKADAAFAIAGEAGDAPHARGIVSAGVTVGGMRFGGTARADRADGDAPLTLGGFATTILPRSAVANRVLDPALPRAILAGKRYTGFEANATSGPLRFFYRQHKVGTRIRMAGVEAGFSSGPMPLLKMPAMYFTVGAARILDEPLRDRNRAWIGIRLEP